MFKRLFPLFDEDGAIGAESGVDTTPAAEVQTETTQVAPPSETGVESEVAADPEKQNNYEKAFAKRLSAEREKWEKDTGEKYKDYETHRELSDYFQKINNMDALTLKERIELDKLQERAEQANVPPEVMKRIDELEAQAAEGKQLKEQQQQQTEVQQFEQTLKEFVKDKGIDHMELWKFMHENGVSKPEIAIKAFQADEAITKLATAKEDAVKEYLASKKAPKVEGAPGAASVQAVDTRKMSWDQVNNHALERVRAASTPQ